MSLFSTALGKLIKRLKNPKKPTKKPSPEVQRQSKPILDHKNEKAAKFRVKDAEHKEKIKRIETFRKIGNDAIAGIHKKFPQDGIRDENTFNRGPGLIKKLARKVDPKIEPVKANRVSRGLRRADAMILRNKNKKGTK